MKCDLSKMTYIEDLRLVAKCKTPRMLRDYIDSGSWTEIIYRENTSGLKGIRFCQKILANAEGRSLGTKMTGQDVRMPVAIAPTGFTGVAHADGEILAARAVEKFGIPFILPTISICPIEDVVENISAPLWFRLYVVHDHEFMENLIKRTESANCSALVLAVDLQVLGQCHRDIKDGLSALPKPTIANSINLATRPEWCVKTLSTERRTFCNTVDHAKNMGDSSSLSSWTSEQFDPRLSQDGVACIKDLWGGKLIIKGVMEPEDAEKAAKSGADASIVPNHSGRQLDDIISAIKALPDVVSTVDNDVEVWTGSGIHSDQDALKAWALGAKGTTIGRAFPYGLGAYGEESVIRALGILYKGMDISTAFTDYRSVQDVDSNISCSMRWTQGEF